MLIVVFVLFAFFLDSLICYNDANNYARINV
jgi:hypothetical protein